MESDSSGPVQMEAIKRWLAIAAGIVGVAGYSAGSGEEAWSAKSVMIGMFLCGGMVYTMIRNPERITWPLVWFCMAPLLGGLAVYEWIQGATRGAVSTLVFAFLFLGIQSAFVRCVSSRVAATAPR